MGRPGCETRNHRWDKKDANGKGISGISKCLDCDKKCGDRPLKPRAVASGQPPASSAEASASSATSQPAAPATPSRAPNEALRAKWGFTAQQAQQPQQAQQAQQATPQPAQPPPAEESEKVDIGQLFRKGAPELIVAGEQKTIKWCGRNPDEPNEEIKDKFDEAFEKWTKGKGKMPKIELAPGPASLLLGIVMWIQMYMTGEPLRPKRRVPPAERDPGAPSTTEESVPPHAHDTSESEDQPRSPPSSALPPRLSVVPNDGAATGAAPSSSVE